MTTLEYATFIAREWNTKDPTYGSVGYVTSFDVDADYLTRFGPQLAGGRDFQEYWVPAEELDTSTSTSQVRSDSWPSTAESDVCRHLLQPLREPCVLK